MGDKNLKVTDKRMFTADGELREEFRHLDSGTAAGTERTPEPATAEAPPEPTADAAPPSAAPAEPAAAKGPALDDPADGTPRVEIPATPEGLGSPTFLDLVTLLAEPIALYLGDAELPNGESAENLEMARLHIDMLEVLRHKTAGNLEVGEAKLLEDLLYRCRLRYVQKRN
ncbi:MAG: DUF1844 domain-containing protein [Thermoanaerobaculia bacterium]